MKALDLASDQAIFMSQSQLFCLPTLDNRPQLSA